MRKLLCSMCVLDLIRILIPVLNNCQNQYGFFKSKDTDQLRIFSCVWNKLGRYLIIWCSLILRIGTFSLYTLLMYPPTCLPVTSRRNIMSFPNFSCPSFWPCNCTLWSHCWVRLVPYAAILSNHVIKKKIQYISKGAGLSLLRNV